jgi:1-acyl-sn-glycerol-3-phosphate acyltransferase
MGRYAKAAGNIALEDNKNFKSLREKVKKALEKNLKVIIFPEGTRSKCGKAGRFRSGAFALASELNAPIVPMAIKGLGETIPKNKILINSVDIKLTILPEVKDFEKNDTSASKMAKYIRNIIIKELEEK